MAVRRNRAAHRCSKIKLVQRTKTKRALLFEIFEPRRVLTGIPSVHSLSMTPTNEGDLATLTGTISDSDAVDTFSFNVGWRPGSAQSVSVGTTAINSPSLTWDPISRQFSVTNIYTDDPSGAGPDVFQVSISDLIDSSGNVAAGPLTIYDTTIDSVRSGGERANAGSSDAALSTDGRYVAFLSSASNLVEGDTNGVRDVFVRDRQGSGATTRVSVDSNGLQSDGDSLQVAISGDGRWVAFVSIASNLVPNDTNGEYDAFVHDRIMGTTTRVSVDSSGNQANLDTNNISISGDGQSIVFGSRASNLVPDDNNGDFDVFLHSLPTGSTTRISLDSAGNELPGYSHVPDISVDGNSVSFFWQGHILVRDLLTNTTDLIALSSFAATISGDGRYVAFLSDASSIVPGDTNGSTDAFVYDRQTDTATRVSVDSNGNEANASATYYAAASISDDGRYVTFSGPATNLIPNDTNGADDVFVHDRQTGSTLRISENKYGEEGNRWSLEGTISGDGRFVAYVSDADNLYDADANNSVDVFVAQLTQLAGATTVTVNNVAPALNDLAATEVSEGEWTTLTGRISDPGDSENFSLVINWGDPQAPLATEPIDLENPPAHATWDAEERIFTVRHRYSYDAPGETSASSYPVQVAVADGDGGIGNGSTSAVVQNAGPVIYVGPNAATSDFSFGQFGRAITDVPGPTMDFFNEMAVTQPDGKVVALGFQLSFGGSNFFILRYNLDGSLDNSFGTLGKVIGIGNSFSPNSLALQSDGSVLLAGTYNSGLGSDFAVQRYTPSGALDFSFGEFGQARFSFGPDTSNNASEILVQPLDDKIVLAGITSLGVDRAFGVARFDADGHLDTDFGNGGSATLDLGDASENSTGAALQADGSIVVVGTVYDGFANESDFVTIRFRDDGMLDTSFAPTGPGGYVITDLGSAEDFSSAVAIQPGLGGGILVAGSSVAGSNNFAVVKYDFSGNLDLSFGVNGIAQVDFGGGSDSASDIVVDQNRQIILTGITSPLTGGHTFALARLDAVDGSLDESFSDDGLTTVDFGKELSAAQSADLLPTGEIVVAGFTFADSGFTNPDLAFARFTISGELDPTFDSDGLLLTGLKGATELFGRTVLAVQPDGMTLVAGTIKSMAAGDFWGVARYNVDGLLDADFGAGGVMNVSVSNIFGAIGGIAVQADGKFLLAGTTLNMATMFDVAVVRFHSDGTVDTSFGVEGKVELDLNGASHDETRTIAIQADGKILIGGMTLGVSTIAFDYFIVRLLTDGTLDASFDGDGKVFTDLDGTHDELRSLLALPNGKIVAAGASQGNGHQDFSLVQYTESGALDLTFGTGGKVLGADFSSQFGIQGLAVQADGKLLGLATNLEDNIAVVRLTAAGAIDTSFGEAGWADADFGAIAEGSGIAVQADGKILAAGTLYSGGFTGADFALARFNADGTLDGGFGTEGKQTADFGSPEDKAHGVAIVPGGGILVVGTTHRHFAGTANDFAVQKFLGDVLPPVEIDEGSNYPLHLRFVDAGLADVHTATISWGDGSPLEDVSITEVDGSGSIERRHRYVDDGVYTIVATVTDDDGGSTEWTTELTVVNVAPVIFPGPNPAALDPTFGGGGYVTTDIPGPSFEALTAMSVSQPDNKIIVIGHYVSFASMRVYLLRYNTDGSVDESWGDEGQLPGTSLPFSPQILAVQPDGRILVGGSTYGANDSDFAVTRLLADGSVDPSFGDLGLVTVDFGGTSDSIQRILVNPLNGKISLVGIINDGTDRDLAFARLDSTGNLDSSFTLAGKFVVDLGEYAENITDAALNASGTIGLVGSIWDGSQEDVFVARIHADGRLDEGFAGAGYLISNFGSDQDNLTAVAIQPAGGILAAGSTAGGNRDFLLMHYLPNGDLDLDFGTAGTVLTDYAGFNDTVADMLLLPNGQIVLTGSMTPAAGFSLAGVAQFNANGTLDSNFGTNGLATAEFANTRGTFVLSADRHSGGEIVLAGFVHAGEFFIDMDIALARFEADGDLDSSFDDDGMVTTAYSGSTMNLGQTKVAVQADGKPIVVGSTHAINAEIKWNLVRYNLDGSLDATFGDGGSVVVKFPEVFLSLVGNVVIQNDGKIVVAGTVVGNEGAAVGVARFHSNGTLDTSFADDGYMKLDTDSASLEIRAVALQPDGRIVLAGLIVGPSETQDFYVLRLLADGSLDETFGTGGQTIVDVNAADAANAVQVLSNGSIVVAGRANDGPALLQLDSSGNLDPYFGTDGIVQGVASSAPLGIQALGVQTDGKLVGVSTTALSDFAVTRWNEDGSLDKSFGLGGTAIADSGALDQAYGLAIQPNGQILAAGSTVTAAGIFDFAIARFEANGTLDARFGNGGLQSTHLGSNFDEAHAIALVPGGGFVVAGTTFNEFGTTMFDFAIARYVGNVERVLEANAGSLFTLTADFSDVGVLDTHTATIDWGDGSDLEPAPLTEASGQGVVTAAHTFITAGLYTAILTVTDSDGGTSLREFEITVTATAQGTTVSLDTGTLIVNDESGTADNDLTISRQGDWVRLFDPTETLLALGDTVQIDPHTVDVLASSLTGLVFFDARGGSDTLTIDLTNGNPLPSSGIDFAGGDAAAGPGDRLRIVGGDQGLVDYNFGSADSGNITLSNFGVVSYSGAETIVNTGSASQIALHLPGTTDTGILLTDQGAGIARLNSLNGTFVSTDFAVPAAGGLLALNLGSGNQLVWINSLVLAADTDLIIDGQAGEDTIHLGVEAELAITGNLSIDAETIRQTRALSIAGTTDLFANGGLIHLGNLENTLGGLLTIAAQDVMLRVANSFMLGDTTITGSFLVIVDEAMQQEPVSTISIGGVTNIIGAAGQIVLDGEQNDFVGAVSVQTAGQFAIRDINDIVIGSFDIGTTLSVNAGGDISQVGSITAASVTSFIGENVLLDHLDNDFQGPTSVMGENATLHDNNNIWVHRLELTGTLLLTAGGGVTQTGDGISVASLAIAAASGINLSSSSSNHVQSLALIVGGGDVSYLGASDVSVGIVGAVTGVTSPSGNISIATTAGGIFLTSPITAASGSVQISAAGLLVDLTSIDASESISLTAGNHLHLLVNSSLSTAGEIALQLNSEGYVFLEGTLTSPETTTITGSSGADIFQLSATAIFGGGIAILGNGGSDRLHIESPQAIQWTLTGLNSGSANSLARAVSFTGISNLVSGDSDDTFALNLGSSLSGSVNGGAGNDTLNYSAFTTAVTANLLTSSATATGGISGIENLTGGSGNDLLTGNSSSNFLLGNGGNDTLLGGLGNDTLAGGAGVDSLRGGQGDDRYWFDADSALGTDQLNEADGGSDTLDFASTTTIGVTVRLAIAGNQVVNSNLTLNLGSASTIENVIGSAQNDVITGNELSNRLAGGLGNDTYHFATTTTEQVDTVAELAGEGTDLLNFSTLAAGDTLSVDLATTMMVFAAHANRTLLVDAPGQTANFENVTGGGGSDVIVGNAANNVLSGGGGDDTLAGGLGTNTLIGGGGFNWANASGDFDFTLTATTLSGTDGSVNSLSNIDSVNLVGGASNNTFTINEWAGTGSVSGDGGHDTISVTAGVIPNLNFTLGDSALEIGAKTISLNSIEVASLTGGTGNNQFTLNNWTGTGAIAGVSGVDRIIVSKDANFILADTLLIADAMVMSLSNITRADLTGGPSSNLFNLLGDWTGNATIDGGGGDDTIVALYDANFTLTNSSLAVTGLPIGSLPTWSLANLETALLNGGDGDNTFTVSGWTGTGGLFGRGGNDTVIANRNTGGFTLTDTALSTGGLTFELSAIESAKLTDGAGGSTFDISGWTGGGELVGGGGIDVLVSIKNADYILSNIALTASDGLNLTLAAFELANLYAFGNRSFDVGGWTHGGAIASFGGGGSLSATRNASFTLTNEQLDATGGLSLSISGFASAHLTGGNSANTFNVSGWTGGGTLTGGGGNDIVTAVKDQDFTLADDSLSATDGLAMELDSIELGNLTGGISDNVFDVGGWRGRGTLTGGGGLDTVRATKNANFTLANNRLDADDAMDMTLAAVGVAELTSGPNPAVFEITSWTGSGSLSGGGGSATVSISRNANFTLTDSQLSVSDGTSFALLAITAAEIEGGAGNNLLDASSFSGRATLSGLSGNDVLFGGSGNDWLSGGGNHDVLVGNAGNDTLIGGAGRDLIIGGTGADNGEADLVPAGIDGGGGDDLLIAGTTSYDANLIALTAIMAEWTSTNVYATRVSNLRDGTGANGSHVLRVAGDAGPGVATVFDDGEVDVLRGQTGLDWFFANVLEDLLIDRNNGSEMLSEL